MGDGCDSQKVANPLLFKGIDLQGGTPGDGICFFNGSFSSGYGVLNILHPLDGILGDFWQPTENDNMPC